MKASGRGQGEIPVRLDLEAQRIEDHDGAATHVDHAFVLEVVQHARDDRFTSEAEFLDFEDDFEVMCKRYPIAVLCQYDVREFSGVALLRALKAHPDLYGLRTGAFLN